MNLNSIRHKTKQLSLTSNLYKRDELLYQIGADAQLITFEDVNQIQGGHLSAAMRSRILTWLRRHANEIGLTQMNTRA
jgi:hypothetical protein